MGKHPMPRDLRRLTTTNFLREVERREGSGKLLE
jgi:hypothetical protein